MTEGRNEKLLRSGQPANDLVQFLRLVFETVMGKRVELLLDAKQGRKRPHSLASHHVEGLVAELGQLFGEELLLIHPYAHLVLLHPAPLRVGLEPRDDILDVVHHVQEDVRRELQHFAVGQPLQQDAAPPEACVYAHARVLRFLRLQGYLVEGGPPRKRKHRGIGIQNLLVRKVDAGLAPCLLHDRADVEERDIRTLLAAELLEPLP